MGMRCWVTYIAGPAAARSAPRWVGRKIQLYFHMVASSAVLALSQVAGVLLSLCASRAGLLVAALLLGEVGVCGRCHRD